MKLKKCAQKISFIFVVLIGLLTLFDVDNYNPVKAEELQSDYTSGSIIQWVLNNDLPDGTYNVTVTGSTDGGTTTETITYPIELVNYYDNVTYSTTTSLGDSTNTEKKMLVVKYHGDLTVNSGVTLTVTRNGNYTYYKGMFISVAGTLTNNGTITMSARGTWNLAGENVYLWRNEDSTYEYIPAVGASGGAKVSKTSGSGTVAGKTGSAGASRQTGGGGSGAARRYNNNGYGGPGGAGTSYSGGAGGGGGAGTSRKARTGGTGSSIGGAGGAGQWMGGGAGNPGGGGSGAGTNGTGGLLILYSSILNNTGTISSNGSAGGTATDEKLTGGGGSGGGSVNIFYGQLTTSGTMTATGGARGTASKGSPGGYGGAGTVTSTQLILDEEFLTPTLSSLTVDKGEIKPSFDKYTNTYGVTLDSENSLVNISAELTNGENYITSGVGEFEIPAGESTHDIVVTSKFGMVNTYTIQFYRPESSYQYLRGITIDGKEIEEFNPETLEYDITLPYSSDVFELDVIRGRTSQEVYGTGTITTKSGNNKVEISVVSEDGSYTTNYVLNIYREHSSKLKSLTIDGYDLNPVFDSETNSYSINIMSSALSVNVEAIAYDEEAKIELKNFGYIKESQVGTITVTEPNSEKTIYTVNIVKEGIPVKTEFTYSYTGSYETFIAPATGFYQIELWGAQGGNSSGNNSQTCSYNRGRAYGGGCGGFGSYTSGVIKLNKDEVLYVYVGQRGTDAKARNNVAGGWNGGGFGTYDHADNEASGSGGGATDIRLVPTSTLTTWNEFESLKSRIMVAAGGGGGSDVYAAGSGGTITSAAARFSKGASQTSGYAFGYGENAVYRISNKDVAGGGSGYFGGYSTAASSSNYSNFGHVGTGGSSYVSGCDGCVAISEESTSQSDITFLETGEHYSGYVFDEITMLAGGSSMPSGTGYTVGNVSNGYAKITMINKSENNFLSNIIVKATNYESQTATQKTYTPTFDMTVEDYYITVDPEETVVTLTARPEDSTAKIDGLGEYEVLAGENIYEINVTAENGNVKTYRVHVTREKSTNQYPTNIAISGLVPSLCSQVEGYCELEPATFDINTNTYTLTVPSRIKQIWFDVIQAHPNQEVVGAGKVQLAGGDNFITIEITSEDGLNKSTYTYEVYRDMTGNTDLAKLEIIDPVVELEYDPDITEYYISIPNEYTQINELNIETDDPEASFVVSGNENFETGANQVNILVTAANGETKLYVLNVYREKSGNTYLSDLTVQDENTVYEITPEFNKVNLGAYRVTVPNEIGEVEVLATVEADTSSVVGTGEKILSTGTNKYSLIVTAEDGSIETYQLEITREKNNNTNLTSITVKNENKIYELDPVFDKDTLEYKITVEEGITSVDITATTEVDTTTYKLLQNGSIKVGENTKQVMTIAENGETKTYNIKIIRPANSNAYLSNIELSSGQLSPEFSKETTDYTMIVENEITLLTVNGIKENILSTVNGNGNYALGVGENEITLTVTAESGDIKTYTIIVTRKPNSNANLSSINTNVGILSPVFNKETFNYTINVENTIDTIKIEGIAEAKTTKVTGNNTYELESGSNVITLITLAEDNITTKTYTINVVKDKSDNDNIENMYIEEASISPKFDSNIISYTAKVPNEFTNVTIHVELEDKNSTYEIIGNENFIVGENEVIVRVTSESGKTKDYKVVITRQEVHEISNYLSSLKINTGELTPVFDKTIMYYEAVVPYSVTSITLNGVKEDETATLEGNGTYNLEVGKNLLCVTVTSTDGKVRYYQVLVTREKNTEARLSNLSIKSSVLSPSFDKDTTVYSLTTTETKLIFNKIQTIDSNASYEIIGNSFDENKEYQVIIRVTAQNEITTKEYILNVTKVPSNNNNLSYLGINGYEIQPTFNKSTTLYTLTVPNNINSVLVEAIPENEKATITGIGSQMLNVGENILVVEVSSESGNIKSYTIVVTKEGSSDANIKQMIVNNGIMSPEFTMENTTYDIVVDFEETELDLQVILNDEKASYEIIDNKLNVGSNSVKVLVTAENGDIKTYTLNVTRQEIVSALLKDIKIQNYEVSPTFNSNVVEYDVLVDNEITSLNITPIPYDKNATVEIIGNENFIIGNNEVIIKVTSGDGKEEAEYTLNVTRQQYSNTFLDYLYTSQGDVTPLFDKYTMNYTIDVGNSVTEIELFGEAVDKSTTVTGLGVHSNLKTGENKLQVTVTTTSGVRRTYYVTVNRAKNSDNYLKDLTLKVGTTNYDLTPEFDPQGNNYTVTVPIGTNSVTLSGIVNELSTVEGLGEKTIVAGDNTLNIVVTSETGEINTYEVIVTREVSTNNYLTEIIPSVGVLEPNFAYEQTNYTINLDSSASVLSFSVVTEDLNATVEGTEAVVVPDGTSVREIIVTAEDGTTRTYEVTVNKERSDIATLSNLSVTGYEFEETFDPNVFEYHITVPNNKKVLLKDEVQAVSTDPNAVINKSNNLTLNTGNSNEFNVTVTAPDGFTTLIYKIIINRQLSTNALLNSLVVNEGYLESAFNPNVYEYVWKVKRKTVITSDSVTVTLSDPNASVTKTESLDITKEDAVYEVVVTSEDKSVTTTYKLKIALDLSADTTLSSLSVDKGYYVPAFNPEVYEYDVYEYIDEEKINVSATPTSEASTITSGTGEVILTDEVTTNEIVVTAEDGSTDVYILKIHKTILKDEGLKNLYLDGLEELECLSGVCELSPEFETDTTSYNIKVPYEYTNLSLITELYNEQQNVKILVGGNEVENYELPIGKTSAIVEVYDGMNKKTKEYTVIVERCKSTNTNLKSLSVTGYEFTPEFNKDIHEYTMFVDANVDEVEVLATPEESEAKIRINGYNYLLEGNNDIKVTVAAPYGNYSEYIIHVVKGSSEYNNYLQSLTVSSGVIYDLIPKFNKAVTEYKVEVENTISKINVEGVAEDLTSTVEGIGERQLEEGNNKFTLTVTAATGQVRKYTVNVVRLQGSNAFIENLVIKNGEISPIFDKGTSEYTVTVEETINALDMEITLEDPNATYEVIGNTKLESGKNTVEIKVISEDKKITRKYTLVVNKEGSSNNYLSMIKISGDDLEGFDKEKTDYSIEVENDIKTIDLSYVREVLTSKVTGEGIYSLSEGENNLQLVVTAENGSIRTYTINVYRKYDNYLTAIVTDRGDVVPVFDKKVQDYTLVVSNTIEDITIIGMKSDEEATVQGNGKYKLEIGENIITLLVTAEDGEIREYNIIVTRESSDNNYLKALSISEGVFAKEFDRETQNYTTYISNEYSTVSIYYELEDESANVEIIGNENLVLGENEVIVRVTATNGDVRDYTINVIVQEAALFSNYLTSLTVNKGTMSPIFEKELMEYTVTVQGSISSIYVTGIRESIEATVTGFGTHTLKFGRNEIPIVVTSKDQKVRTYKLIVYRLKANEARLSNLMFEEGVVSPVFNKNVYKYTMTVGTNAERLTELLITTVDEGATYEVIGSELTTSPQEVIVRVTAPDLTTTKDYTITVTKEVQPIAKLLSLTSNVGELSPEFDKDNTGVYEIVVENSIQSIILSGEKEYVTSTVEGLGVHNLEIGSNYITVKVTSETGNVVSYAVNVIREESTNNYLANLGVRNYDITPVFDKEIKDYTLQVPSDVTSITIYATAEDENSVIKGIGQKDLSYGDNTFSVVVTSAKGEINTYNLVINREYVESAKILNMSVEEGELTPAFDKDIKTYDVYIPNEKTNLTFDIKLEDENSSYKIIGNENFVVGNNEVKVEVTTKSGTTETYIVNAIRQISSNNYLKDIIVSEGELTPTFDKYELGYRVEVESDVETITINAEPEDTLSAVIGIGDYTLVKGENKIRIKVISASNVERVYTVNVIRKYSEDNLLSSLVVSDGELTPVFDPNTNEYNVVVSSDVDKLKVDATADENSIITGLGEIELQPGENQIQINVTSESGEVNTYIINVTKELSNDTSLLKFEPDTGVLDKEYSDEINEYTLSVDSNTSVVNMNIIPTDDKTTVTGDKLIVISDSKTTVKYQIVAEDQSTREIILTINKEEKIQDIILEKTNYVIVEGQQVNIVANVSPSTIETTIVYKTENTDIVLVDNQGLMTGLSKGITTVKVYAQSDPTIVKEVKVEVLSKEILSSVYEINKEKQYIIGMDDGTTLEKFISNLDNESSTIKIYDKTGNEIKDTSKVVKTGLVVKLVIENTEYDSLIIIVRGDINEDGIVDISDKVSLVNHILLKAEITDYRIYACDLELDNMIDVSDKVKLVNYILKKISTLN